jgi:hypothetical protein
MRFDTGGFTLKVAGELNFSVHLSFIKFKKKKKKSKAIPVTSLGGP